MLQALPRDIDSSTALAWILNQDSLRHALRKALMPPDVYMVFVDRRLTLKELLRRAEFELIEEELTKDDPDIKPELGYGDQSPRSIALRLVAMPSQSPTSGVLKRMNELGLRPADVRELITLAGIHPEALLKFRVVALGTRFGNGSHPAIGVVGQKKVISSVEPSHDGWELNWMFACVEF